MENDNNSNSENILNSVNNESNKEENLEEEQKDINNDNNNLYEEENEIEQLQEDNENSDENNIENEEEQIIIENEDENEEKENEDSKENNEEEMIYEENEEEKENNDINNIKQEKTEEKEIMNKENEEEINEQNKNIKIEEYSSEIIENKDENKENNEEYILNTLAKLKKNNKLKIKTKDNSNENNKQIYNTTDKMIQTEFDNIEPIQTKNKKLIFLSPTINSCRIEKKDNIALDSLEKINDMKNNNNYKYGINQEGISTIISENNKNEIIAYIVQKNNKNEKNELIDTKGNSIPITEEGNYIYKHKNEKDNTTKTILIKDCDVQNPEIRINANQINSIQSEKINTSNNNNNYSSLKRNIYNKSNDDIKRILNLDDNHIYTPNNLINYNNLMDIWRHRYGKRKSLYEQLNLEYNSNNKKENNKMVKRTNSILKMSEKNYISSFTDSNYDSSLVNNNFVKQNKYRIPIYYNGIINRKYENPLLKKYNMTSNNNYRYNPLLKAKTNKNIFFKNKYNFTDILRARLNNSDDYSSLNNQKNISFEKLNFKGKTNGNNYLYINKRYNYKCNNILKNNLYKRILQRNREKNISNSFEINNGNYKGFSVINNNIYNIIKNINNKKKKIKYSILSSRANELITKFNDEFKIKENSFSNNNFSKKNNK